MSVVVFRVLVVLAWLQYSSVGLFSRTSQSSPQQVFLLTSTFYVNISATKNVGSDEKVRVCRETGAHLSINYKQQNFAEEVLSFTGNKGNHLLLHQWLLFEHVIITRDVHMHIHVVLPCADQQMYMNIYALSCASCSVLSCIQYCYCIHIHALVAQLVELYKLKLF